MADILSALQAYIAGRILTDDIFIALPSIQVISEDQKDLINEIERRVAKIGLCVVVGEVDLTRQGISSYLAKLIVSIFERPIINRQGTGYKTGRELGLAAWAALGDWSPDDIWAPMNVTRFSVVANQNAFKGALRELELETSIIMWPAEGDDYFAALSAIMAPHVNGGFVPMRVTGGDNDPQWQFGTWQATLEDGTTDRQRLYAVHTSGSVIPVAIAGEVDAYQWVYGEFAQYRGGVEHWAPHDPTGIVPIQLVGASGSYQWGFGVKVET
jgi:hypothetical protein